MRVQTTFFCYLLSALIFCLIGAPVLGKAIPATAKIVFSGNRELLENRDIYLMNTDGQGVVNLTNHPADDVQPVFSPTGEHILFCSDRDRGSFSFDLYLMNVDGSDVRRVFAKSQERIAPTWSPDGKQIAYVRSKLDVPSLYIAPIDGKKEDRVVIGIMPVWSPDGKEIAFINRRLKHPRYITILNVRTSRSKFFFPPDAPAWLRHPAWSPDGNKLAFAWTRVEPNPENVGRETAYIVNRDGTGLHQLIGEAGSPVTHPIWSPAGDELLYERPDREFKQVHIFKISVMEGLATQLTDQTVWNSLGDWFDPAYALPVSPQPQLLTTIWAKTKKE
ncbi:hypothetical protein F4X88_01400 [Candidatus Poribacteria bacterium]|nr:hypothetical protein [Candidatus Poribacteria bacterium]MXV85244.1 hypothetical protein [Candidatus Poribacteria bacterium]MYA54926.1 hypothetical protein [Candidatus Poribacteria bacterium]